MSALRLTLVAVLLAACASRPPLHPRLGQVVPDVGLVVGAGQANGHDWTIGVTVEGNLICHTLYVDIVPSKICSGLEVIGTNDLGVSGNRGQLNLIAGFADATIAWVEVSGENASFKAPVVPLQQLGQSASAFGVFISPTDRFSEVRFIDGAGKVVQRLPLPRITVNPGATP